METKIIDFARLVYSNLGPGYSERVYHNAMEVCFRNNNISYETERIIPIVFQNHVIGNIRADLVIENSVIVELKAVSCINNITRNQAKTYFNNMKHVTSVIIINFQQSDKSNDLQYEILSL